MRILVYGTLKKGYGNHIYLNGAEFIGEKVLPGYKLYNAGFPVAAPSPGDSIIGEEYEIDPEKHLFGLDRLEGNGHMYHRTEEDGLSLYVGDRDFWGGYRLEECPRNSDGIYYWSR